MKDIISATSMSETRIEATRLWHEYNAARKKSGNPIYKDLSKIYNQVRHGRKVIDIGKVLAKGGIKANGHPNLAIVQAKQKTVQCMLKRDGTVIYRPINQWKESVIVNIPACFGGLQKEYFGKFSWSQDGYGYEMKLQAPMPIIPPKVLPANLTDDYYVLWEVDEWKMVPPTDPYLLRRITSNIFVVCAGWDLTAIEKAAMAGRMHL